MLCASEKVFVLFYSFCKRLFDSRFVQFDALNNAPIQLDQLTTNKVCRPFSTCSIKKHHRKMDLNHPRTWPNKKNYFRNVPNHSHRSPVIPLPDRLNFHFNRRNPLGLDAGEPLSERRDSPALWYFSARFVRHETPSRKAGISYEAELKLRFQGTDRIRDLCRMMGVLDGSSHGDNGLESMMTVCTAQVYFQRFFMIRSLAVYDAMEMAMACVLVACNDRLGRSNNNNNGGQPTMQGRERFVRELVHASYKFVDLKQQQEVESERVSFSCFVCLNPFQWRFPCRVIIKFWKTCCETNTDCCALFAITM